MSNCNCGIFSKHEKCHRLTYNITSSDNNTFLTGNIDVRPLKKLNRTAYPSLRSHTGDTLLLFFLSLLFSSTAELGRSLQVWIRITTIRERLRSWESRDFLGFSQCISGASPVVLVVKNLHANAENIRDMGLIPGSGRSPGGGYGNPLQYSCLESPMDRGAWRATIYRITKS